ncbi:hypothetical protein AB664_12055 [Brucella anthropi]|uniref:Uncharacterized protein n=2 Tax=Brucella TaxID=234 RepID=A0A656Z6Q2_BRUAN|nr:hypothetical protein AB664_12055 [Brucella anthropi]
MAAKSAYPRTQIEIATNQGLFGPIPEWTMTVIAMSFIFKRVWMFKCPSETSGVAFEDAGFASTGNSEEKLCYGEINDDDLYI